MIKHEIIETLKIVYEKLKGSNATWILSGSTSLFLQGVDIDIKNDIDILIKNIFKYSNFFIICGRIILI